MAERNSSALPVLTQRLSGAHGTGDVDAYRGLSRVLSLGALGIYGQKIRTLHKDGCDQDLGKLVTLLDGCVMGHVLEDDLHRAIDTGGQEVGYDALVARITGRYASD
jgi:hypothetical protein